MLSDENKYARRKDVGLSSRAVRERWNMPKNVAKALPEAMVDIALNSPDEKARIAAGGVVVKMMGQNQSDEHLAHKTDGDGAEKHKVEVVYVNRPRSGDDGRADTSTRMLPVVDQPALPSPERSGDGDDDGA